MGGAVIDVSNQKAYPGRVTPFVIITCIIAASGGLLFGYDLGVTGGVESMASFQSQFFPSVYEHNQNYEDSDPYCKFNDQMLQLFTSSLFLAGLVAGMFGGITTKRFGRRGTMLIAGCNFLVGATLNAAAQNLAMLVVGRIFLGFGIGFANQAVPLYLSEMAPSKYRGALNIMFQLATTIGILVAQLINYAVEDETWGWRLSLGLAAVPAIILTVGSIFVPDTPNSLIQRGQEEKAKAVLKKIRGVDNVDEEFDDMVEDTRTAALITNPWTNIIKKRYRPQLTLSVMIPTFQQFTGINAIMFYTPVLFSSLGTGHKGALLNAVIIGCVNLVSTSIAVIFVDKWGRRPLLLEAGVQMLVMLIATSIVIKTGFGSGNTISDASAWAALVTICLFVAGFAWSWGPLGWLIPSEIQPLETRSAGQAITVAVNFFFSFLIGQLFLSMLCAMKWGIFLFFAGWVCIMTVFVFFLLPETKGVPLEYIRRIFRAHPVWGRTMGANSVASLGRLDSINDDDLKSNPSAIEIATGKSADSFMDNVDTRPPAGEAGADVKLS